MEKVQIFQDKKVRTHWDAENEEWYYVVGLLTDSINPTDYLKKMRKSDPELAAFMGTNRPHVEMMTETGKQQKVLATDSKAVFRIIQSIPSPKAKPFKQWLAQVELIGWTKLPTQRRPLSAELISIVPRATARDGLTNGCNQ